MGNLLGIKESFLWEDCTINRGDFIFSLNEAIDLAGEFGDDIYGPSDFYELQVSWGNLYVFLCETQYEELARIRRFSWLTQIQHTTLIFLLALFQNQTVDNANNLDELNFEYPNSNNGLIGCLYDNMAPNVVYDENSWNLFHRIYVSRFTYQERCMEYEYFNRFFIAELTEDINQINQSIYQGLQNPIFQVLHNPHIPDQQIHVHFNDQNGSALNLNGSWHHNGFLIPVAAREVLCAWGFNLPPNHY